MNTPGELIDIGGRCLHLRRMGEGRPTVVLESGGGGGSSPQDWPVMRRVARDLHCVSYDRAGLGWSDPAPGPRSFEGMARDLADLLAAAGEAGPLVMVGSSFGGLVARTFCRLHPDQVVGVVLVDAAEEAKYFGTMTRMRAMHEGELRDAADKARRGELRAGQEAVIRGAGFTDLEQEALLHVLDLPAHFEASLAELAAIDATTPQQRLPGGLGSLGDLPLVVLSHGKPYEGDYSPWEEGFDASQRRLAALSTRSAHIVATNNGHSIGLENPRLVAAAILAVARAADGGELDTREVKALAA